MTETIQVAIISAAAAILGTALGYIASAIQASKAFARQQTLDSTKRTWQLEDARRDHRLATSARRLDQAEDFIGYVTEDFQNIRHAAIFIVQSEDPPSIQRRIQEYAAWRDAVPKRVYAYGASIQGLSSPALINSWKSLYTAFEALTETYKRICADKERDPSRHPQEVQLLKEIDTQYESFNEGLGPFITELDRLRAEG